MPAVVAELVPLARLDVAADVLVLVQVVHDAGDVVVRAADAALDEADEVESQQLAVLVRRVVSRPHVQRAEAEAAGAHRVPEARALALEVLGRPLGRLDPGLEQSVVDVAQAPPEAHPLVVGLDAADVEDRDEALHLLEALAHVGAGVGSGLGQHALHGLAPAAVLVDARDVGLDAVAVVLAHAQLVVLVADRQQLDVVRGGGLLPGRDEREGPLGNGRYPPGVPVAARDGVGLAARLLGPVHHPVVALDDGFVDDVLHTVGQPEGLEDLGERGEHVLAQDQLHRGARDDVGRCEVQAVLDEALEQRGRALLGHVDVELGGRLDELDHRLAVRAHDGLDDAGVPPPTSSASSRSLERLRRRGGCLRRHRHDRGGQPPERRRGRRARRRRQRGQLLGERLVAEVEVDDDRADVPVALGQEEIVAALDRGLVQLEEAAVAAARHVVGAQGASEARVRVLASFFDAVRRQELVERRGRGRARARGRR